MAPTLLQRRAIAHGVVSLEAKIKLRNLPQDSDWDDRVTEMYTALVKQDAELPTAMLKEPEFGRPGHVIFAGLFQPEQFPPMAAAFVNKVRTMPNYQWTNDVIFLLGGSPDDELRNLVRDQFENFALRNAVLIALSESPNTVDRDKFIAGLDNSPVDVMADCVKALLLLPASDSGLENVALLRAFRKLAPIDQERIVRDQLEELLRRNLGQNFGYQAGLDDDVQAPIVEKWTAYVQATFPQEFARQSGESHQGVEQLRAALAKIDWSQGDAARGELLFGQRACVQCHSSRRALGPDLQGAATRFSKDDLFTAIMLPNRDVSPRYQTTLIETKEGRIFTGMLVYEAIDGVVIRNAANQTFRIEMTQIETRKPLSNSLMPSGLLKGFRQQDYADLYAYLRSLNYQTAQAPDDHRTTK